MKRGIEKIFASKYWWLMLLVVLFAINYLASVFHARFDLTKEKRYTLSKATKNLLRKLDDEVQIDVFLKGEFPAGFRKLANTTKEFLGLLKDRNASKIHYRFVSPLEELPGGKLWGDSLTAMGAMNINLTVQKKAGQNSNIIFPVALISYKGKQSLVNLFPGASRQISQNELNTAEALMEYQFLNVLDKLTQVRRPGIAYALGNGEPADERTYKFRAALQERYDFRIVDLKNQKKIPDSVDLLLLVKPEESFSEQQKLMIDQYIMNGGKLLCFIDNLYAELEGLRSKPQTITTSRGPKPNLPDSDDQELPPGTIAYDRNLNLTDLFFKYGLRINTDLVMDLRCDVNYLNVGGTEDNPQMEFLPWNYFPLAETSKGQFELPGYLGLRFANSIDTINVEGVIKTPLIVTSAKSRVISTPALISLNENKIVPDDEKFRKNAIPVAMLLEGKFPSLYRNRISQSQLAFFDSMGARFKDMSEANKMIVVADGDFVLNEYIPQFDLEGRVIPDAPMIPIEMGWNKYTYSAYLANNELGTYFKPVANKDFFLNCVEYLISNPAISETRNKDIVLRLLDGQKVKQQKAMWQFINIGIPILVILLFALVYQQLRKRKYAS